MLAATYLGKEQLPVVNVPDPVLAEGEVLLAIDACSVCGTDLRTYRHGDKKIVPPRILGHEFCGRVIESRAPDANVTVGDRVVMYIVLVHGTDRYVEMGRENLTTHRTTMSYHHDGAFAPRMKVPALAVRQGNLFRVTSDIPSEVMSLAEPLGCCLNAHSRLRVSLKDTVAIIGAGPIGIMHASLARLQGAQKVIVLDNNPARLEMARRFDIDAAVLVRTDGSHREEVRSLTAGHGPDVVIVAVSAATAQNDALEMAAKAGRVNFFAGLPKSSPIAALDVNQIHYKELEISGSYSEKKSDFQAAFALLHSGRFPADKIITHRLPLERITEAFLLMESGQALKVCVLPGVRSENPTRPAPHSSLLTPRFSLLTSNSFPMPLHHLDLHIDGRNVPASDGSRHTLHSPATGEPIGSVPKATDADLQTAVQAARVAFKPWAALTAYDRERILRKATAHVRTQTDLLAHLMALEQGKPLNQSRSEIGGACDTLDYYAAEGVRIEGSTNPTEDRNYRSWVNYQPVGVCGLITPWNYPVSLLGWKLGPALAAGCTVVVKPTSVTPLSPLAFCAAMTAGGLPAGVVNVITGSGALLGEALVRHPHVAKIAMTGSSATGKRILSLAAPFLKKVSLELGGQCPAIVCTDADVELAAKIIAYKAFRNCGQSCSSVNRVYVHVDLHDRLIGRLKAFAENMSIGDGITDPQVDLGPMATADGVATVAGHVADALRGGAQLITGGSAPAGDGFAHGHYFRPTVLAQCRPSMKVMCEETFGPVVGVQSFTALDEAIALANDTPYGLVAYLFTRDFSTTVRVTEALEAGTVCVNHGAVNTNYGPYAGWKDSGYGVELGRAAVFEYLKPKHIKVAIT